MQLWMHNHAPRVKNKSGKYMDCSKEILNVKGGGKLHSMILEAITNIGRERVIEFESFVRYCIDNPYEPKWSNKVVDMSKLNTTTKKTNIAMIRRKLLRTSTQRSDFINDRYFTIQMLRKEVQRMEKYDADKSSDGDCDAIR